jgi:DUF4097 and DUF4098 domain-containing protein YvlB
MKRSSDMAGEIKMKTIRCFLPCVILLLTAAAVWGQEPTGDKVTVPISDPSRPAQVHVSLISGGITVQGYDGKEVVVQAYARAERERERRAGRERSEQIQGMKRITNTATGLTASEQNNVVDIVTQSYQRPVDLTIQVPRKSSLKLHTVNDGDVKVDHVQGEIEVEDINGSVTLTDVSGSAVVYALNGDIVATFAEVAPEKPMSFSSMNGKMDVTFPPSLKANLMMKTDNGEIFSDFDVQLQPNAAKPMVEDTRGKGGKYKIKLDKAVYGTINGGGPEIQFKGYNGDIYIRKSGK